MTAALSAVAIKALPIVAGEVVSTVEAVLRNIKSARSDRPHEIRDINMSSPLVHQDLLKGKTSFYTNHHNKSSKVGSIDETGEYFGVNAKSELPLQPNDGKRVFAVSDSVVLVKPGVAVSAKQQLTYEPSTGRVLVVHSSSKYKKNIEDYDEVDVAALFDKLKLKSYVDASDQSDKGELELGFIAEDLKDFPSLLLYGPDGEIEGVNYDRILLLLIKYVQNQSKKIDALSEAVKELAEKVKTL